MMKSKRRLFRFTLIELIVSMAVFALLGMMVAQLFSASQKLWTSNVKKNDLSIEGRAALDLITNLAMNVTCAASPHVQVTQDGGSIALEPVAGGSDYFEVTSDGDANEEGNSTSRLYMATKTDHAGIKNDGQSVVCFAGIQMVPISDESDPADGTNVLVASFMTDENARFSDQFPENQPGQIRTELNANRARHVYNSSNYKVIRIASNVVDFQVRTYASAADIKGTPNNGNTTCSQVPDALDIRLVLMTPEHYALYKDAEPSGKPALRDRYGRMFRRLVWLGRDRTDDFFDDYNEGSY